MRDARRVALAVLLVAVNIAAVVYLQWRLGAAPGGESSAGARAPLPVRTTTEAPADSPEPAGGLRGPLWLAADADGHVLRVTVGSCEAEPSRAWFAAPGRKPREIEIPGLARLLGLDRTRSGWQVVGAGRDCGIRSWTARGAVPGTWRRGPDPADGYHLDPVDLSVLHTPGEDVDLPDSCLPEQLVVSGGAPYLVCDGRAWSVDADGDTVPVAVPGGGGITSLAVTQLDGKRVLASVGSAPDCAARVSEVTETGTVEPCVARKRAGLAIAWAGRALVLDVAGELYVREPGGDWAPR